MTTSFAIIFIGLALCSNTHGQTQSDPASAIFDKVSGIVNTTNLNETALQQVENVKDKIREKCEKNGGSFDDLLIAKDNFETCLKGLIDFNELQVEIEEAKPRGELDEVFQRYCMKNNTLLKCMTNFTSAMEPCLGTQEKQNLRTLPNVTKSFINFVCHKEGDRIALFIASGGSDCILSKQNALQDCFNSTFGSFIPNMSIDGIASDIETLPLAFNIHQCNNVTKLQECAVRELEKCDDPTPANMMDSLFTFVKNATPCHDILARDRGDAPNVGYLEKARSSASTLMNAYSIVLIFATGMLRYV